jgi:hypothetical protein
MRISALICVVSVLISTRVSHGAAADNVDLRIEELISNPVPITECVTRICKFANNSNRCYYAYLRWQPNAFFYREMPVLDDLLRTNVLPGYELLGKYDSNYFRLWTQGTNYFQSTTNGDKDIRFQVERHFAINAAAVYNFGVFDTMPGGIRVTKSGELERFQIGTGLTATGHFVYGTGSEITPSALKFSLSLQGREIPWEVRYEYAGSNTNLPKGIPQSLTASVLMDGRAVPQYSVEFESFNVSNSNLDQGFFSMDNFLKAGIWEARRVGSKYVIVGKESIPVQSRHAKIFLLVAGFLVSIPLVLQLFRGRNERDKEKNT